MNAMTNESSLVGHCFYGFIFSQRVPCGRYKVANLFSDWQPFGLYSATKVDSLKGWQHLNTNREYHPFNNPSFNYP
jgi:hypothetical protein